jgi:hypothetical protein
MQMETSKYEDRGDVESVILQLRIYEGVGTAATDVLSVSTILMEDYQTGSGTGGAGFVNSVWRFENVGFYS